MSILQHGGMSVCPFLAHFLICLEYGFARPYPPQPSGLSEPICGKNPGKFSRKIKTEIATGCTIDRIGVRT